MADHPPEYWRALLADMVRRLNTWELTKRARAVGIELAQMSFGEGAPDVAVKQSELAAATGHSKWNVSAAIAELIELKVLREEKGRGPAVYRLLPRGELAEPAAAVDQEAAARVREAVRRRNAGRRGGEEASGQARLTLGVGEILAEDLALGSAARAAEEGKRQAASPAVGLDAAAVLRGPLAARGYSVAEAVRRSMLGQVVRDAEVVELTTSGRGRVGNDASEGPGQVVELTTFAPLAGGGASPCGRGARVESFESLTGPSAPESIESGSGRSGGNSHPAGGAGSAPAPRGKRFADAWRNHLVDRVEALDPPEFNALWRGQTVCRFTWLGRIEQEPHVVEKALGELAEAERSGTKLRNKLGLLYRIARKKVEAAGRVMRMLFC